MLAILIWAAAGILVTSSDFVRCVLLTVLLVRAVWAQVQLLSVSKLRIGSSVDRAGGGARKRMLSMYQGPDPEVIARVSFSETSVRVVVKALRTAVGRGSSSWLN